METLELLQFALFIFCPIMICFTAIAIRVDQLFRAEKDVLKDMRDGESSLYMCLFGIAWLIAGMFGTWLLSHMRIEWVP